MPLVRQSVRYLVCLLGSFLLIATASYANYYRQLHVPCGDCFIEFGFPFKFWMEGGFAGTRLFVGGALLADICAAVILGMVVGWTWGRTAKR